MVWLVTLAGEQRLGDLYRGADRATLPAKPAQHAAAVADGNGGDAGARRRRRPLSGAARRFAAVALLLSLLTLPLSFPGVIIGFFVILLGGRQGLIADGSAGLLGRRRHHLRLRAASASSWPTCISRCRVRSPATPRQPNRWTRNWRKRPARSVRRAGGSFATSGCRRWHRPRSPAAPSSLRPRWARSAPPSRWPASSRCCRSRSTTNSPTTPTSRWLPRCRSRSA